MKHLGKIVFLILLMVPTLANATVVASVDKQSVTAQERVTLNLTISGEDINRPALSSICNSDIVSSSSQTSITMVNGNYKKSYILSYSFEPQKSCTIEPMEFQIDGKKERTEAIKIEVKPFKRSLNDDFVLTLSTNKDEVYVGEPFELTLLLKQKPNIQAVDSKFTPSSFKGFWVKHESKPQQHREADGVVTKLIYTLAAQRDGTLEIDPAQMSIATRSSRRDSWGGFIPDMKWRKYLSNSLKLNVKKLPKGISLIGDFNIQVRVDKKEINQNEALNVTVEVDGYGNLEDIPSFKPSIAGVNIFDEKISIDGQMLTQKIAFVADKDFTIPPFQLTYFDTETKKVKMIRTKEIKVKVNGVSPKELKIKREEPVVATQKVKEVEVESKLSYIVGVSLFMAGLFVGVMLMLFKPWSEFKRSKPLSIKEPKTLLIKLMPHRDDVEVAEIIESLEKNIYSGEDIKIDKKILKKILTRYKIEK